MTEKGPSRTHHTSSSSSKIHSGPVTALHVLPELLVTASKDRDVKLWERPSMQLVSVCVCVCVCVCKEDKRDVRDQTWGKESQKIKIVFFSSSCNNV